MPLASEHMPLIERLRKGANCVVFLDGAPEPAADVADMLRKASNSLEQIADIAEGSTTANSLPHIAKIARGFGLKE